MVRKCRGEENNEQTILRLFNKNKRSQYLDIRLKLRGDKLSGYLINGTKKKKEIPIPKIETFLSNFHHFTKEEIIGRRFSSRYTSKSSEFIFLLLSSFPSFTFKTSVLFSKDENFTRSLDSAKKDFDNFYLGIRIFPHKNSLEGRISNELWQLALSQK